MDTATRTERRTVPWNTGKLLRQKLPLKLKEFWRIWIRLLLAKRTRTRALFNLDPAAYGTHTLRRTKATLIYRRTRNLRAVLTWVANLWQFSR